LCGGTLEGARILHALYPALNILAYRKDTPRAVANLVVIEAPGKIDSLTYALRRGRFGDFHILATRGHLYEMPDSFSPLGIDLRLQETARAPKNADAMGAISDWAFRAERVLIATDADQEGDVLAWDIAQIVQNHGNVWRVRLRSLDTEGVLLAFANPEPVRARDAWPGTTRRILDRLIGATFTLDGDANGFTAGRVQSALLGVAATSRLPVGEATLVLPACDDKDHFIATFQVFHDTREEAKKLVDRSREFIEQKRCVKLGKIAPTDDFVPWNYGEAVLNIATATGRSLDEASESMQRLYEHGRMSYPRSSAHSLTGEALSRLQRVAQDHGVRFDAGKLPVFSRRGRHTHESPRPLSSQVDVCAPLLLLSGDEATLALITRHLLACGQPHLIHRPDPSTLPDWAQTLDFSRRISQWLRPWPRRPAAPQIKDYSVGEVAMRILLEQGLGRPSTLVGHAQRFASRGLCLSDTMRPTDKAQDWLAQTPMNLLDPSTSRAIEAMIDESADLGDQATPPAQLVSGILERLGLWERVEALLTAGPQIGPKPGLIERVTPMAPRPSPSGTATGS
jgi:DNA topoisomerase-1